MKAVLSNRIFMQCDRELLARVAKTLTHIFRPENERFGKTEVMRTFNKLRDDLVSMPIGCLDLIPSDFEIIDKRVDTEINFPKPLPHVKLRESQQLIHDELNDNWIINAKPGYGKTFTALTIAAKLKRKTLVVVHRLNLLHQWKGEVKLVFGKEASQMGDGIVQYDKFITIASVQTLAKNVDKLKYEFGTVIVDECHHVPATTFSKTLDRLAARYKIGLSATLTRKDGKHLLLDEYIGTKVYIPKKENVLDPLVLTYKTDLKVPGNLSVPWANRVTELTKNPEYRDLIIQFAKAQASRGHTVLVVSDRVEFLEELHNNTEDSVLVTGTTEDREEQEEQIKNGDKSILYGSISMYSEGISINNISCLIPATLISNESLIIQLVGRVIRQDKYKMRPEVIDIVFSGQTGTKQFNVRAKAYMKEQYEVKSLNDVL